MTNVEDELVAHLEARAAEVTVPFTANDVRSSTPVGRRRSGAKRSAVVASGVAATLVVVAVGLLVFVRGGGAGDRVVATEPTSVDDVTSEAIVVDEPRSTEAEVEPTNPTIGGDAVFRLDAGLTLDEIIDAVDAADLTFDGAAFEAAVRAADTERLWLPATTPSVGEPLEGRLLAGDYSGVTGDAAALVEQMLRRFEVTVVQLRLPDSEALVGLAPEEALIVASIIEQEASGFEDRQRVARVIYNRLAGGEPLGIDSVLEYALGREILSPADLDIDSPYNTRRVAGLPPTPIGTFDVSALTAALDPAPGEWRFYLPADSAGELAFASTLDEFNELVTACREQGRCR